MLQIRQSGPAGTDEAELRVISWLDCGSYAQGTVLDFGNRTVFKSPAGLEVSIDLFAPAHCRRLLRAGQSEALVRAVRGRRGSTEVCDASAGFGRDAMVLQASGARVVMFERHPVMWLLLYDALRRARADFAALPQALRCRFSHGLPELAPPGMAETAIRSGQLKPEVVYFDPMFPARTKSASVKKNMQAAQMITGGDSDVPERLAALISLGVPRVVLKRPAHLASAAVLGRLPDYVVGAGAGCHFDCYAAGLPRAEHAGGWDRVI